MGIADDPTTHRFRKKAVEIEAIHFERTEQGGGRFVTVFYPLWLRDAFEGGDLWYQGGENPCCTVRTLEGEMKLQIGDWLIRGVKGELYPCKPDIFEMTYERA